MYHENIFTTSLDLQSREGASTKCGTGLSKMYINPNGSVYPCACLEKYIVGDLYNEDLEIIIQRIRNMNLSMHPQSPCLKCPAFEKCKGGCPGSSFSYFGSFDIGEHRCPVIQDLVSLKE